MKSAVDARHPDTPAFLGSTRQILLWSFGLFTLPVLTIATLWHLRALADSQPTSWPGWLLQSSLEWYPWALFMPLIVTLSRACPIVRERLAGSVAVHLVAAILLSAVQNGLAVLGSMIRTGKPLEFAGFSKAYSFYLVWMEPWSMMIYAGIVAAILALEYRMRVVQGRLLAARLESEVTKAQLDALQSQLQPHFLFNALNSISVLVRKGETDSAQQMLGKLSELLRQLLNRSGVQTVPLRDELALVRQYLDIEQARFGERLQVKIEADESAMAANVPVFLLQTLVENAVRHGLGPKPEVGHVVISATCRDGLFTIKVLDDGVGMPTGADGSEHNGVGLRNTRTRLECLYGSRYTFDVQSSPQSGTAVTITLPLHREH